MHCPRWIDKVDDILIVFVRREEKGKQVLIQAHSMLLGRPGGYNWKRCEGEESPQSLKYRESCIAPGRAAKCQLYATLAGISFVTGGVIYHSFKLPPPPNFSFHHYQSATALVGLLYHARNNFDHLQSIK